MWSSNKPLPESKLENIHENHMASLGHTEFTLSVERMVKTLYINAMNILNSVGHGTAAVLLPGFAIN